MCCVTRQLLVLGCYGAAPRISTSAPCTSHPWLFFLFLFSLLTSRGLWNHRDTHQLLKSRCFRNEEKHYGRCFSELPLAVMAALEGFRLPSLSRREHHEGRTWRQATVVPPTAESCVDHVATRVRANCSGRRSHPHMQLQPWYQLLSTRGNMARAHTFAGGSLFNVFVLWWQSASAAPRWCFPVHPRVGGIFLLGEPWSNASCQSHRSSVPISQVFISAHIPNGTHGINVKICMEITRKTGRGKFLPLMEGIKVRLVFVALFQTELCDDFAPLYL